MNFLFKFFDPAFNEPYDIYYDHVTWNQKREYSSEERKTILRHYSSLLEFAKNRKLSRQTNSLSLSSFIEFETIPITENFTLTKN